MSICCFINTLLCIITIYQLYIRNTYILINDDFKKLTIVTMIAYDLCIISNLVPIIIRYNRYLTKPKLQFDEGYLAVVKTIVYCIGNISFFIVLFFRIKISFQVSRCIMYYVSILLIISVIWSMIFCGVVVYSLHTSLKTSIMYRYLVITSYGSAVSEFLLNISLFILFIYKLKNRDSVEGVEAADNLSDMYGSSYYGAIDNNQKAIWNVMIKHCVLFGIALLSNQAWYVGIIVGDTVTTNGILSATLVRNSLYNAMRRANDQCSHNMVGSEGK